MFYVSTRKAPSMFVNCILIDFLFYVFCSVHVIQVPSILFTFSVCFETVFNRTKNMFDTGKIQSYSYMYLSVRFFSQKMEHY